MVQLVCSLAVIQITFLQSESASWEEILRGDGATCKVLYMSVIISVARVPCLQDSGLLLPGAETWVIGTAMVSTCASEAMGTWAMCSCSKEAVSH